ncbi:hypothetical protein GQ53DRAFT_748535 [Thozetella sp. PMI_491]|nr:hypothetical protein GQ53DRAFT_748535 [Thozetella sp. PMI_491]
MSPHSESDDGASDGSYEEDDGPTYSAEELAEIFLDLYRFLSKLHFDPADLRIPPPGGWPNLLPDSYSEFKSDFTIEVMRHLPYFHSKAAIHYKSALIDYTAMAPAFFGEKDSREDGVEFWSNEGEIESTDVLYIAHGHESGGRDLMLNASHGEIVEDMIRCDTLSPVDIKDYFEELKEAYRTLKLIPCLGKVTIEAEEVPEREEEITEAEVRAQTENWGTNLDIQYVRQVYRQHGWPDAFRRDEAMNAIRALSDSLEETRDGWENESEDFLALEWS